MDIYRRYGPALLRKATRLLGNRDDALDVVQGLFTDLFERGAVDGLRIDRPDAWIHLRKSNTEPIMRIIVEARTPDIAWHILQETKEMIAQVKTG